MSDELLSELWDDFESARRARGRARRHVAGVLRDAPSQESIQALEAEARKAQAAHDHMQELAGRCYRRNQTSKARKKIVRRNKHGEQAGQLYADLRALEQKLDKAKALERMLGVPGLNERYVIARHHLMQAIFDVERKDEQAQQRKAAYIEAANIPSEYADDPDKIWYYVRNDNVTGRSEIHLFYGGKLAPDNDGNSPDGLGHGHHVLNKEGDAYRLTFERQPIYIPH